MRGPGEKVRFALDQNYPATVIAAFGAMIPGVELAAVTSIDPHLAEMDDWELLLSLGQRRPAWDGLITNDDAMLALPREMTVLAQTRLTLIVAKGEGDSPVRSIGLLLAHLHHICHHTVRDRAQVWRLSVAQKNYDEPRMYLERIAEKAGMTFDELWRTYKLTSKELHSPRT
jgi:hypothetical protein